MDIKLERAIIRTYRKLREMYDENNQLIPSKLTSPNEVSGLFVNFCYAEYGVHTGLSTENISMVGSNMGWKFWINNIREYNKSEFCKLIEKALSEVEEHEFCSMWLRASFENPKDDTWAHPVVREAFKDYKGIQDTHYDNYLRVTDEVDKPTDVQSTGLNFTHTPNVDRLIGEINLKHTLDMIKTHR